MNPSAIVAMDVESSWLTYFIDLVFALSVCNDILPEEGSECKGMKVSYNSFQFGDQVCSAFIFKFPKNVISGPFGEGEDEKVLDWRFSAKV